MDQPRALLTKVDAGLLAAYAALAVAIGWGLGQDLNWDLLNYHFYNPHQLLAGRLDRDVQVAAVQSYHNPLLDLPFYVAVRQGVPPIVFFLGLSALHGVALWAVHRLTMLLVPVAHVSLAQAAGALAAITGAFGAGFRSVVGSTMGDDTTAVLLLVALLLVAWSWAEVRDGERPGALIWAGLLTGIAVGAKFTVGPLAIGLATGLAFMPGPPAARLGRLLRFAAGGACGLALAGGYWMWLMYSHFDSPVFPYFNTVFQSRFAPVADLSDPRFGPTTPMQRLFYPFFWIGTQNLVAEPLFRDGRMAAAFLAIAAAALAALVEPRPPEGRSAAAVRLRLVIIAWAVSYAIWLPLFSYYRYVITLELLSGTLVIGVAAALAGRWSGAAAIAVPACLALIVGAQPPDWGRRPWSDSYFGVEAAQLRVFDGATVLMWDMPQGYVVPFFPESTTFVRVLGTRGLVPGNAMWDRLERRIADAPADRLFLLDLEPGLIHDQQQPVLARFGLVKTGACGQFGSFAGPFRLCRLERRQP